MRILIGCKVGHHNAVGLIAIDDLSSQVRPKRAIVILKSRTINNVKNVENVENQFLEAVPSRSLDIRMARRELMLLLKVLL